MTAVSLTAAVIAIMLFGCAFKVLQGRWLAPAPLFSAFWAIAIAMPPLLAPEYVLSRGAIWYIVLLVAAFCFGAWVAATRAPRRSREVSPRPLDLVFLRRIVVVGTVSGFAATVIVQAANGYSASSILSARALIDAAASYSVDRYAGQSRIPIIVPLLMGLNYAAGLVAPFAARDLPRIWALACYLAPLTGAAAYAVLTTARSAMLTVAFFLVAGWIVSHIYSVGETPPLRFRLVAAAAAWFLALGGAFIAIAFLRVGSFDASVRGVILDKLGVYAVGYLPGFSHWFSGSAPTAPRSWGGATFAGIVNAGDGETAAFMDRAPLGSGLGTTNIFTAWRYVIEDFGIAGTPLVIAVLGWAATEAWRRTVEQPSAGALVVSLSSYAFILNSNTQTVFLFTNVCLAIAIVAVALRRRVATADGAVDATPHPPHRMRTL